MKKALFTMAIVLLAIMAQAQIKVHDDNWVSIGCLNNSFGLQVTPIGYTYFRTQSDKNYSWATLSMANQFGQKHWIVENLYNDSTHCWKKHMFYVYGNGSVYCSGLYSISYPHLCLQNYNSSSIYSEDALTTILGINGYYFEEDALITQEEIEENEYIDDEAVEGMIGDLKKRKVGMSADNLAEVFPDAVRTDPQARLCIDYNAIVTMLVGAVKQQQAEIENLRKALEEHGLLEPEKH